ncbi:DUF3035 domain-containing protein [Sphingorhabdus sp. Alg239-R122]|uniref:DUF3035 domain-containing protein n=1 Tax=Sphingorhabdus sp. Alg239-R122 TaxID=2305989 RepID=UPI0013DC4976|nr:DUF3035 domain-containing protein [Sphingorhabdus sp. Alg239-R122]
MRKLVLIGTMTAMVASLSACGSGGGIFNRDRPDEFAVSRQAPLVIPPDFAMAPPQPGAPSAQSSDASQQALEALFGGPQARSTAEAAAVRQAGEATPGIRSSVGDPETNTVNKGTVTRDIIAAPEGDGQNAQSSIPEG